MLRRTLIIAACLLAGAAQAQVEAPPCPATATLFVEKAAGDELRLSWNDTGCEPGLARLLDGDFAGAAWESLLDPYQDWPGAELRDSPPAAPLAAYRLDARDGDWPFWEACRRSPGTALGPSQQLVHDNGVVAIGDFGFTAGDIEAQRFVAPAPMRLESLALFFFGAPGPVELRILGDFGNARPDVNRPLTDPILLDEAATGAWISVDVSDREVLVHPNEHFWVAYVHVGAEPVLVLDDGGTGAPTHSYFYDPDRVPVDWGHWSGWQDGNEYLVRVTGEAFCEVDQPLFADRSTESGLASRNEAWVSWGDANGDGYDDLLLSGPVLLANDQAGGFNDLTEGAGLGAWAGSGYWGLWGDFDNDRDQDIYLGVWTVQDPPPTPGVSPDDVVLLNSGFGSFTQVDPSGAEGLDTTATATIADYDEDGNLDLFVGNWLAVWPNPPSMLDRLYLGNGDGTFAESTAAAGMGDQGPENRPTYGLSSVDFDNDGDIDIYAGTYFHDPDFLWRNQLAETGSFGFVDVAAEVDLDEDETPAGGLTYGADWGDFDGDGDLDALAARIAHPRVIAWADPTAVHVNGGPPDYRFTRETAARGIAYNEGGLDASWVDYDNDGDLDAFISNVYELRYCKLYRNDGDGTFTDVSYEAGIMVADTLGHGWADHDRDGDLDLVLANEGPGSHVWLFDNQDERSGHWVSIRLEGGGCFPSPSGCNCGGVGARVFLTAGGLTQLREVTSGGGHNGQQNSLAVEFGLGSETGIEELRVRWPCGAEASYAGAEVDRFMRIREGLPTVLLD